MKAHTHIYIYQMVSNYSRRLKKNSDETRISEACDFVENLIDLFSGFRIFSINGENMRELTLNFLRCAENWARAQRRVWVVLGIYIQFSGEKRSIAEWIKQNQFCVEIRSPALTRSTLSYINRRMEVYTNKWNSFLFSFQTIFFYFKKNVWLLTK